MNNTFLILSAAATAATATFALPKLYARVQLSRAKHRSLAGHSKMSRRAARLIPFYDFGIERFFDSDGAPPEIERRAWKLSSVSRRTARSASPEAGR